MDENDKNQMLDSILLENEKYEAKMWGTLMFYKKEVLKNATAAGIAIGGAIGAGTIGASGALSNQYCYIGITKEGINFALINSFKVHIMEGTLRIKFDDIKSLKVKKSIIPGRYVINMKTDRENLKIALMNNAIGSNIQHQKESVKYFCERLKGKE